MMHLAVFLWAATGETGRLVSTVAGTEPTSTAITEATISSRSSVAICNKDYNETLVMSLVSLQSNEKVHRCSGVIISRKWVLSAAHCFMQDAESPRQIKYVKYGLGAGGGHSVEVKFFKAHNLFDIEVRIVNNDQIIRNVHNDIAIVRTAKDMVLDNYHNAADMKISGKQPPPGAMAVMCGFDSKCELPVCVHHEIWYDLEILPFQAYPVLYGIKREDDIIKDCKLRPDSGAPLFHRDSVVGILTTFPIKCANDQNFGVFTDLARTAGWVTRATFDADEKGDFSAATSPQLLGALVISAAFTNCAMNDI